MLTYAFYIAIIAMTLISVRLLYEILGSAGAFYRWSTATLVAVENYRYRLTVYDVFGRVQHFYGCGNVWYYGDDPEKIDFAEDQVGPFLSLRLKYTQP